MGHTSIKLVECPRDAMQGWPHPIPTAKKVAYLNALLRVGFDTIDFGSFVSPKAIPQMADTKEVLAGLDSSMSTSALLAIVANPRGAEEASAFAEIQYLGYPFSISETFQQRNTNASIAESFKRVAEIQETCVQKNKGLVIYISMGFGNPYGDPYSEEVVMEWVEKLVKMEIGIVSLADTVGVATPRQVSTVTAQVVKAFPSTEIGVHLHSRADNREEKLQAAIDAGCRRFDGALKGIGGCPMAGDDLVGNMNTEWMITYLEEKGFELKLDRAALDASLALAATTFI